MLRRSADGIRGPEWLNSPLGSFAYQSEALSRLHLRRKSVSDSYPHFPKTLGRLNLRRKSVGIDRYPHVSTPDMEVASNLFCQRIANVKGLA